MYVNFTDAKDLIEHLLVVDKKKRYTAIETLSHPWILLNGDMSRPPESSKLDEMRKNTRKELELQAKQSYDSYQKLKEKRKLEQQAASWSLTLSITIAMSAVLCSHSNMSLFCEGKNLLDWISLCQLLSKIYICITQKGQFIDYHVYIVSSHKLSSWIWWIELKWVLRLEFSFIILVLCVSFVHIETNFFLYIFYMQVRNVLNVDCFHWFWYSLGFSTH